VLVTLMFVLLGRRARLVASASISLLLAVATIV
jgi:hypothetical protein